MVCGNAEPPIATRLSVVISLFCDSRYCSSINHTVGTAAVNVTFSVSSSSWMLAPSICAPGITSLEPVSGAANAIAQALAWNIGTTGSTESVALMPITSA
jgi:hypothetical protein